MEAASMNWHVLPACSASCFTWRLTRQCCRECLQTSGAEFEVKLDATKLHPLVVQTSAFVSAELRVRQSFASSLPASLL